MLLVSGLSRRAVPVAITGQGGTVALVVMAVMVAVAILARNTRLPIIIIKWAVGLTVPVITGRRITLLRALTHR